MSTKHVAILGLLVLGIAGWVALLRWLDSPVSVPGTRQPVATPPAAAEPQPPTVVVAPRPPVSGMPRNSLPVAEPPAAVPGARLLIVSPANGATVSSPLVLKALLQGMRLAPSGTADAREGHIHVLVDIGLPVSNAPIPRDGNHFDFGSGESEGEVELAVGKHTLQLLLGDGNHVPHTPPVASERIEVLVR